MIKTNFYMIILTLIIVNIFIFGIINISYAKTFTIDQLSEAVLTNNNKLVNKIIKSNSVDINQKDSDGTYPLEQILVFEKCEMAKTLLKAGANPYLITSENISIYETVMKTDNKYLKLIFKEYKK